MKSLSVFVPLFNEEEGVENLSKELEKLEKSVKQLCRLKVYLVNDGSTDQTGDLLKKFFDTKENYQIIKHDSNRNLGGFLKTSIENCSSDFIGFLDSDCSYTPDLVSKMFEETLKGYDIVNASPYHPDGNVVGVEKSRLALSKIINKYYGRLLGKNIHTTSSICKIYNFNIVKDIEITRENFVSITELFLKALHKESSFIEFPCTLMPREYGNSKMKVLNTIIDHVKFIMYLKDYLKNEN